MFPLISIIVPTLNSERTIHACLKSLTCQTYPQYELVVVDGGSSDRTAMIVKQMSAENPSIHFHVGRDAGIYDAMNKGVSIARGEWLLFLGSDDEMYDRDVLQKVFSLPIPIDAMAIYGKALVVPDQWVTPIDVTFEDLLSHNLCHQAIFYSRKVFSKWKYDLRFKILSDWDLNLKLFANHFRHIISVDLFICKFLNLGVSANWRASEEFLRDFQNKNRLYLRYLPLPIALKNILLRSKRLLFKWIAARIRSILGVAAISHRS